MVVLRQSLIIMFSRNSIACHSHVEKFSIKSKKFPNNGKNFITEVTFLTFYIVGHYSNTPLTKFQKISRSSFGENKKGRNNGNVRYKSRYFKI